MEMRRTNAFMGFILFKGSVSNRCSFLVPCSCGAGALVQNNTRCFDGGRDGFFYETMESPTGSLNTFIQGFL